MSQKSGSLPRDIKAQWRRKLPTFHTVSLPKSCLLVISWTLWTCWQRPCGCTSAASRVAGASLFRDCDHQEKGHHLASWPSPQLEGGTNSFCRLHRAIGGNVGDSLPAHDWISSEVERQHKSQPVELPDQEICTGFRVPGKLDSSVAVCRAGRGAEARWPGLCRNTGTREAAVTFSAPHLPRCCLLTEHEQVHAWQHCILIIHVPELCTADSLVGNVCLTVSSTLWLCRDSMLGAPWHLA